eukprot:Skav235448  [mRNA]  locus=scaffold2206:232951:234133:- [translate_table: standard]
MILTAFRCIQDTVAHRTSMVMAEKSERMCFHGDTFFGRRVRATDGSLWLFVESNNLFLPLVHPKKKTPMFEEVHYTCTFSGRVQARNTPKLSDTCDIWVKKGESISAVPAPEHPGWLDTVAHRTSMVMAEKSERMCFHGDTFFGRRVRATDGSLWLFVESNNLFLPLVHPKKKTPMFEEVHYTCTFSGRVQARNTPKLSNTCDVWEKKGESISAVPAPEHPGWLVAHNKLCYPMKNPQTGEAIFEADKATPATGDVEQGQAPDTEDDPACEQTAAAVSLCIPCVGFVTFCTTRANNHLEGSQKRKWGDVSCAEGSVSLIFALVISFVLSQSSDTYSYSGYY